MQPITSCQRSVHRSPLLDVIELPAHDWPMLLRWRCCCFRRETTLGKLQYPMQDVQYHRAGADPGDFRAHNFLGMLFPLDPSQENEIFNVGDEKSTFCGLLKGGLYSSSGRGRPLSLE